MLEAGQVRKELGVDEVAQVVTGLCGVVVDFADRVFRRGPTLPAIGRLEDVAVALALELCLRRLVVLEGVEVLEKEQPG